MLRVDARVEHRDRDALAVHAGDVAGSRRQARAHLIGAGRLVGHRHPRADRCVARQVINRRIGSKRGDFAAVRQQDRRTGQAPHDPHTMFGGERVEGGVAASNDDACARRRMTRFVPHEVERQMRAVIASRPAQRQRRRDGEERDQRNGPAESCPETCHSHTPHLVVKPIVSSHPQCPLLPAHWATSSTFPTASIRGPEPKRSAGSAVRAGR